MLSVVEVFEANRLRIFANPIPAVCSNLFKLSNISTSLNVTIQKGFPLPSGLKSKSFLHQNFTKLLHPKFKNKTIGILENL